MTAAPPEKSIRSMTGYAEARSEQEGWLVRIGLRSVNHRFLDLRVRTTEGFERFEPLARQLVRERLRRGHVDVTVQVDSSRAPAVQIHREIAAAYLRAAEDLRREFDLAQQPDLVSLLRLPGVVAASGVSGVSPDEEALGQLEAQVRQCLLMALDKLDEMRQAEGAALAKEMSAIVAAITEKTARLQQLTERSRPAYAQHLKTRLEELLSAAALDPARLAQEAAVLAERADVSEELARLRSHVEQFRQLVAGAGEIGKKLDFLLQEMQREANTLLSKTPGLAAEGLAITDLGLQIKADIEKLREQAQNVE